MPPAAISGMSNRARITARSSEQSDVLVLVTVDECAAVPARLDALYDEAIGAGGDRLTRLVRVGDRDPHRHADSLQALDHDRLSDTRT